MSWVKLLMLSSSNAAVNRMLSYILSGFGASFMKLYVNAVTTSSIAGRPSKQRPLHLHAALDCTAASSDIGLARLQGSFAGYRSIYFRIGPLTAGIFHRGTE